MTAHKFSGDNEATRICEYCGLLEVNYRELSGLSYLACSKAPGTGVNTALLSSPGEPGQATVEPMAKAFVGNLVLYPPGGPTVWGGIEYDNYHLARMILAKNTHTAKTMCAVLNSRLGAGRQDWQYIENHTQGDKAP